MIAGDGLAALLQGDSVAGIQRMRHGLDQPGAPHEESAYPRLQLALALGHAYEAAGQRDSAAVAYSRFLRLWDKADSELQGRLREARDALQELAGERPTSR